MTRRRGFTLIEIIIYLAILAALIGGGVVAAFYIIDSQEKNKLDINIESEAHFLLRKIEWAMTGSAITFPASGASGDHLSVNKAVVGAVTIDIASQRARISINGAMPVEITNDRVKIPAIVFDRIAQVGTKPEAIHASTTISNTLYETTKYLRK